MLLDQPVLENERSGVQFGGPPASTLGTLWILTHGVAPVAPVVPASHMYPEKTVMNRLTASPRRTQALVIAAAVLFAQACSSKDDTTTPAFTLTPTPAALSVAQGAAGTSSIAITRTDLPGGIAFTVSGAPAGVTAAMTPTTATGNAAVLTIVTTSTATIGLATITITGTSAGAANQVTTVALTVTALPSSITLTPVPAILSIAQGASGVTSVGITRSNFAGGVSIVAQNLPAGVTASTVPASTAGTTASVTFTATAGATPGTTVVTLRGSGTGLTDATTTLSLTVVTAASGVTLTATPSTLTVARGASGVSSIAITRTNFATALTLSAENLPAGVTAGFVPNATVGTASSLTLTASASATQGVVTIIIRGTGAGIADATTTLQLTIP